MLSYLAVCNIPSSVAVINKVICMDAPLGDCTIKEQYTVVGFSVRRVGINCRNPLLDVDALWENTPLINIICMNG